MMKRMLRDIKSLLCLMLSLGLILSLAACGSAGSSTGNNASAAPSEEAGSQAAAADDKTTMEQTNEPADNEDGNDCQNEQNTVRKSVNDWIAGLGF